MRSALCLDTSAFVSIGIAARSASKAAWSRSNAAFLARFDILPLGEESAIASDIVSLVMVFILAWVGVGMVNSGLLVKTEAAIKALAAERHIVGGAIPARNRIILFRHFTMRHGVSSG